MKALFIINDPPYGTERVYKALRLAPALVKKNSETEVTVFLMADAVLAAKAGQKTPEGFYNVERMLKRVLAGKGKVLLCGTCMDAPGLTDTDLMGARSARPWTSSQVKRSAPTRCWCSELLCRSRLRFWRDCCAVLLAALLQAQTASASSIVLEGKCGSRTALTCSASRTRILRVIPESGCVKC